MKKKKEKKKKGQINEKNQRKKKEKKKKEKKKKEGLQGVPPGTANKNDFVLKNVTRNRPQLRPNKN